MKIFITGATGYIGHKLALSAVAKGYIVHALVRDCNSIYFPKHKNIICFKGDVIDYDSVVKAMKGCDYVMHAAALTRLWNKDRNILYKTNVGGTKNVLEAACLHNVKKFVFTSSCAVLGPSLTDPVKEDEPRVTAFENDYEVSKHCAEEMVKEYGQQGLFTIIVCPPRVYGPGINTNANTINKLIDKTIKRNLAFIPAAKNVLGNYAFIDDVVEGHFLAMQMGLGGERYTLGGENVSYDTFFKTIIEQSGKKIKKIVVPKVLLMVWAFIMYSINSVTGRHSHLNPKLINRIFQNRAVSCNKAIRQLNYQITPLQKGIQLTILYLKSKQHA